MEKEKESPMATAVQLMEILTLCKLDWSSLVCPVLTGMDSSGIFCVCTSSTSDGRFLTGAEQGPIMNQGDGIFELS